MQFFYIKQNSQLPRLRMDLINDGRHDYNKFYDAIQNADITFTMVNDDTGITKIAKAPCTIELKNDNGCVEKYVICYDWRQRDTKEAGNYTGIFEIVFNDIKSDDEINKFNPSGLLMPTGNLIMPIREELKIIIL